MKRICLAFPEGCDCCPALNYCKANKYNVVD